MKMNMTKNGYSLTLMTPKRINKRKKRTNSETTITPPASVYHTVVV